MDPQQRLAKVQAIFNAEDGVSPVVEAAYRRRVEESNNLIENFNEQAKAAISEIKQHTSQTQDQKRKTLALYRTYCKLLFYSDKSDIIDESSTNVDLEKLVNDHRATHHALSQENVKLAEEYHTVLTHLQDWKTLSREIPDIKRARTEELNYLQQTSSDSNSSVLVDQVKQQLQEKDTESKQFLGHLHNLLDKIIWKYLDFSNATEGEGDAELKHQVENVGSFINKLIDDSIHDRYSRLDELNDVERGLVNNLLLSNVIELKQLSGIASDTAIIAPGTKAELFKLRNFV